MIEDHLCKKEFDLEIESFVTNHQLRVKPVPRGRLRTSTYRTVCRQVHDTVHHIFSSLF